MPNVVQMQINRILGTGNWNIGKFMASLNKEVSAWEIFESLKSFEDKDELPEIPTMFSIL